MYCRYCGKELPDDSNFCPACGAKQKEMGFSGKAKFKAFVESHKALSYTYFAWLLIHITLFLSSSKERPDGFYPWDKSISYLLGGGSYYEFSLLDEDNVYDCSEFFFYTIVFPIAIYGFVKSYPLFSFLYKKIKKHYRSFRDFRDANKRKSAISNSKDTPTNSSKNMVQSLCDIEVLPPSTVEPDQTSTNKKEIIESLTAKQNDAEDQSGVVVNDTTLKGDVRQKMPLFRRFVGTIIDKMLLLFLFIAGSVIISPYGAPGNLGTYVGLLNVSPENYEYIDKAAMNRYGIYYEGVSEYYQDRVNQKNEPPHIGSTLNLDMSITFTFILLNLIYYVFFESILSASPGKRLLGGVIIDSANYKIKTQEAVIRGLCGGMLMSGAYYLLHLQGGLSNTITVVMFFLLLDLPVLLTKKSLLDIFTGTTYVKN